MAVNPRAASEVIARLQAGGKTPHAILQNINTFIDAMWARTTPNMAAQETRAAATGGMIRAGGAPNNQGEAAAMVRELTGMFANVASGAGWSLERQVAEVHSLIEHTRMVNEAMRGAHVAIKFKSGGPFIYPSSTPGDYAALCAAGSSGKEVWRIGWGPDRHPSYTSVTITPERLIDSHPVLSSWVICFYLLSDIPIQSQQAAATQAGAASGAV